MSSGRVVKGEGVRNALRPGRVVELNPSRDLVDMTAMVGAKLLKEIAGRMLTVG